MANYLGWILTDKGRELLARTINNETKINITKLKIGSGYNIGNDRELTDLINPKNTFPLNTYERKDSGTVEFVFIVTNRTPEGTSLNSEAYRINEMGIFAQDDAGEEIMYAYNKGTEGDYIPIYNGKNSVEIIQKCIVVLDQNADLQVNIDSTMTYVTKEKFDEVKEQLNFKSNKSDVITNLTLSDNILIYTKNEQEERITLPRVVDASDSVAGIISKNDIRELATVKATEKINEFGIGTDALTDVKTTSKTGIYLSNTMRYFSRPTLWILGKNGSSGVGLAITTGDNIKVGVGAITNNWVTKCDWLAYQKDLTATDEKVNKIENAVLGNATVKTLNGTTAIDVVKNDIVKYTTNTAITYYKIKKNGRITIPTDEFCYKLSLNTSVDDIKKKFLIGTI